jgi:ABC-type Fe3+/spermidine/putrescine transport system ATPase subunit
MERRTSDRIVVMNQGRIEQVDGPFALYNRPRTRFVAGFIGRTNFLEGTRVGGEIGFPGFALEAGRFPEVAKLGRRVVFSVRPQSIGLSRAVGNGGGWWVEGCVVKRAYLGEHWDDVVAPGAGSPPLRVAAAPMEVFEVEEKVWLQIDPRQVAHIPEEP